MSRWQRFISTVGATRVISALGVLYVALAVARFVLLSGTNRPLDDILVTDLVIGLPGVLLLYGSYRLPATDLQPEVYPRIVARCLAGIGVMLGVVGLLALTGLNRPYFTPVAGTALGSIAGFAIGLNEARALSRAHEAEQHRDKLQQERDLRERIFETSPVGIAVVDADGSISSANEYAAEILGFSEERLTDLKYDEPMFQATGPDGTQSPEEIFQQVLSSGEPVYNNERQITRADGKRIWLSVNGAPLPDPSDGATGVIFAFEDITERKQLEDELRQERDLRERIFETSPTGILVINTDGNISFVNEYATELLGMSEEEVSDVESLLSTLEVTTPDGTRAEGEIFQRVLSTGGAVYDVERRITPSDSDQCWISINAAPLRDSAGEVTAVVFTLEDITERKHYQDRLISLNELSQDLTDAETEQTVSDLVVETARDTLLLPLIAIALYDEKQGQLRYTAQTSAVSELVGDSPLFESERGLPWQAFSEQTQAIYDDLYTQTDVSESETPLQNVMILPLGEHGVFISGATTTNAFSDTDVSVAQMLAATTRSALDRVKREQTVREQRNTLAEQNEALERVQRINSTIRGITTDLIQASTRDESVQAVCDRLATVDVYQLAWIGTHDAVTDEVIPEAWAGDEDGYLETITVTADEDEGGTNPTGKVVRTRETQVQNYLATDPPFEPWRQAAINRGCQACIAVPLVYQDTLYGVLTLYASDPDVFNQMEEAVLTELGETIGYALNTLERRQALVSDQSVELEFQLRGGDPPFFQFAAEHDCEFEFENIVQRTNSPPGIFFTIRGVPPDEVLAFGENSPEIEELILVSERDGEALFEAQLRDSAFFSALLDRGAMPQTLTATGDEGAAVIRVPRTSNIRAFVELFEAQYEDVELVGRREVDEPIKTQQEFEAEFRTQLTERQEEILKTAYVSGFFDWPREVSAQELADMLNVSQPTVSRHIRGGERKLFGLVFEEEE